MKVAKLGLLLVLAGACAAPSKQRSDPANPPIMDDPEVSPIGEPNALRMTRPTTGDEEAVAIGGTQTPEDQSATDVTAVAPSASSLGPAYGAESTGASKPRKAEAELKTVKGVSLDGEATLREVGNGVQITLKVEDAAPGKRGVHIHERGDCSDLSGKSMGEHFSPGSKAPHGLPTQREHHFGDLGNIQVEGSGKGQLDIIVPGANLLDRDTRSLLGKAMVIREREDVGTGPSGESGAPIACAVIVAD